MLMLPEQDEVRQATDAAIAEQEVRTIFEPPRMEIDRRRHAAVADSS